MLNQDFKEFIISLNDNQVRYLVIGGYAVSLHGYPRYTKDIDQEPDQIIQLGYPPNRIDLITTPPGVDFEPCYASRMEVEIDDVKVNFIDLEHLKQNKRAAGRLQDLADLENLQ